MAGVKGRSGTNRGKDKPWSEALRLVMYRDDRKALLELAEVCKASALSGDLMAMKEIGDRLDGKPAQAVEMSGSLGISHEDALNELDDGGSEPDSHDAPRASDTDPTKN